MVGINPFAKNARVQLEEVPNLPAFERLPADYLSLCVRIGTLWKRSPQNRRVREAADMIMAKQRQNNK